MLDSRMVFASPRIQSTGSSWDNTRVLIYRKQLAAGHVLNDGPMGTNVFAWIIVYNGWPCSIVAGNSEMAFIPEGQSERGDYTLKCQYRRSADGGLFIRERDVIVDLSNRDPNFNKMLVLWSHDPANYHSHILAGLKYGPINEDITVGTTEAGGDL